LRVSCLGEPAGSRRSHNSRGAVLFKASLLVYVILRLGKEDMKMRSLIGAVLGCVCGVVLAGVPAVGSGSVWAGAGAGVSATNVDADPDAPFVFTQDGEYSKKLNIPTYEWMPRQVKLKALILAVHGLTLHGQKYRVIARGAALRGAGVVALDMRGFGRCRLDPENKFSTAGDDKHKINYEKSYQEIVELARLMHEKYPHLPLIAMGESLGTPFCIRLAAEHPALVWSIVLSGPTVKVSPDMYLYPPTIMSALVSFLHLSGDVPTTAFARNLVSDRPEIAAEMLNDPLVLKKMSLLELIKTDLFVAKTLHWARGIKRDMPILILQGSLDKCMVPGAVINLTKNVSSADQRLRWLSHHAHLLLETDYLAAPTLGAIADWFHDHGSERMAQKKEWEQELIKCGGKMLP
jgi:alpha-beta hydrolase superfamily lysophospholipase